MNRNQAVAFRAQSVVTSQVGVIQKEKVLPMKRLLNLFPVEHANHHVLVGVSGPVRGRIHSGVDRRRDKWYTKDKTNERWVGQWMERRNGKRIPRI